MEWLTKTFTPRISLKADAPGSLSVEFATLNVIDKDGDVTIPGAFGQQGVRIQASGHDTMDFSIGKGTVVESGDKAIMNGLLNLDMSRGKDAYASLKFDMENGEPLQEWSYIYSVIDSSYGEFDGKQVRFLKRLKVFSVDPVFLGAGIGTRTTGIKSAAPYSEFVEQVDRLLAELVERTKSRLGIREKEGRTLSQASVDHIRRIMALMMTAHDGLGSLLDSMGPPKQDEALDEIRKGRLEFERLRAAHLLR